MKLPVTLLVVAAAAGCTAAPPSAPIQIRPESLAWAAAPASMPAGARIAVLEGQPQQEGLFTQRLEVPAGSRIPPHRHPRDERVTVLSGRVCVGFGERFDERAECFGPGSFYLNPAGVAHYVWFTEASVVQLTGLGPWRVEPVAP